MEKQLDQFLKLDLKELFEYVKTQIEYGWVDNQGEKHFGTNSDDLQYHLQTAEETLKRKIAICWDKTELLRYYFEKHNYEINTYFIYLYITDNYCPSHSIITYKENGNYIWFDASNPINLSGIHKYATEKELIIDLKKRFLANGFLNDFFDENIDLTKIYCYEYSKPNYGIRGSEFYEHCRKGRKIIGEKYE